MMRVAPILIAFLLAAPLAARAEYKIYAVFLEDTRVELSDGAVWMMDKGDVFPIVQFKNMQKNVILRLAGATFTTDTDRIRVLKAAEVPAGVEAYRNNVRAYLESTSKKILQRIAPEGSKAEVPPIPVPQPDAPTEGEPKPDGKVDPSAEPKPATAGEGSPSAKGATTPTPAPTATPAPTPAVRLKP